MEENSSDSAEDDENVAEAREHYVDVGWAFPLSMIVNSTNNR